MQGQNGTHLKPPFYTVVFVLLLRLN